MGTNNGLNPKIKKNKSVSALKDLKKTIIRSPVTLLTYLIFSMNILQQRTKISKSITNQINQFIMCIPKRKR